MTEDTDDEDSDVRGRGTAARRDRRDANGHHQMELSYSHWTTGQEMVRHCRELISFDKQMAREYEALARAHSAKADTQK